MLGIGAAILGLEAARAAEEQRRAIEAATGIYSALYGFDVVKSDLVVRIGESAPPKPIVWVVCRHCGTKTRDLDRKNCVNCAAPLEVAHGEDLER